MIHLYQEKLINRVVIMRRMASIYGAHIPFCHDDPEINLYMEKNLNWENGDALIMLGRYCQERVEKISAACRKRICSFA